MADAIDIERKLYFKGNKKILIFNPLKEDFQGKWNNHKLPEYKIPSQENKLLDEPIAKVFGSHIVDLYIATKEKNYSREKAEALVFPND